MNRRLIIACDICETTASVESKAKATKLGWTVAEDELNATELHGLCPNYDDEDGTCERSN